jgi:hypothetical protein
MTDVGEPMTSRKLVRLIEKAIINKEKVLKRTLSAADYERILKIPTINRGRTLAYNPS